MPNRIAVVLVLLASFLPIHGSHAQASPFVQIMKARQLYACSSFLRAMADSATDEAQKATLSRSYAGFMVQATAEALAAYPGQPGGPELAVAIGNSGQKDFERFMAKLDTFPTVDEQNAQIKQYGDTCVSRLNGSAK